MDGHFFNVVTLNWTGARFFSVCDSFRGNPRWFMGWKIQELPDWPHGTCPPVRHRKSTASKWSRWAVTPENDHRNWTVSESVPTNTPLQAPARPATVTHCQSGHRGQWWCYSFHTGVTSVRCWKWLMETCQIITVTGRPHGHQYHYQSCTSKQPVPFLVKKNTHTHTYTHHTFKQAHMHTHTRTQVRTHTISLRCIFLFLEVIKQNNSQYIWLTADGVFFGIYWSFNSSLKTFLFKKNFSSVSLPWYATGVCVWARVCVSLCACVCIHVVCVKFWQYAFVKNV